MKKKGQKVIKITINGLKLKKSDFYVMEDILFTPRKTE